ncbi:MAG: hypothetical protein AAGF11_11185 [Myxococcota bacterium]
MTLCPTGRLAALLLGVTGCTPSIDPSWLITGPRELALDVEVIGQGPYGQPIIDTSRSSRDALPLDTLSLRPIVIDTEGPIEPESLDGRWILCSGLGNCLLRDRELDGPRCTGTSIQPAAPCIFDEGGPATLTIPDVPPLLPEISTIFTLVSGPTVAYVASPPEGPGLDACIARFEARERLDGCLLMERALGLGPLGELVETLEAAGFDLGIDEGAESLLARPRNRNPAVQTLQVMYGTESVEVNAGARVVVPRDQEIRLTVQTTEEDLDAYEAMVGDQTVLFSDNLDAQWWFDQEVDRLDELPNRIFTSFRAGTATGTVRVYVVVRDNLGGEGWGFVDLELD